MGLPEGGASEPTTRVQSKLQAFGTKDLAGTWDPAWLAKPATLEATRAAAIEKAAANSASDGN